jgi:hypothetical protein
MLFGDLAEGTIDGIILGKSLAFDGYGTGAPGMIPEGVWDGAKLG